MYRDTRVVHWQTPVSDLERLILVSLHDGKEGLEIVLQSLSDPECRRWRVRFKVRGPYRNTDEMWLSPLFSWLHESKQSHGNTFQLEGAEWVGFRDWVPAYSEGACHYVISTMDDVVEVVAAREPAWQEIEPGSPDDPSPGRVRHLFLPEDRDSVRQLVDEIQARQVAYLREHPPGLWSRIRNWFRRSAPGG